MNNVNRNLVISVNRKLAKLSWPLKLRKTRLESERANLGEFYIVCTTSNTVKWSRLTANDLIEINAGAWDHSLQNA